ncbi:hypothetical protein PR202_ga16264 [Eleusine coracana subsp. coracana]|uniref:DUF1618 domain-containing protein n=1 Tax=Eleusine coracana subsp. coracana TaxID=191504 RepID=A0AAV5CLI6_ELECO|nr:hypothetical protein PR202_ga16264 [Eleusine coracana subsp. coracana]
MLVPTPSDDVEFRDEEVVLLRCRRSDTFFFLAVMCRETIEFQSRLHLYSSETGRWSTRLMEVVGAPKYLGYHNTDKAIAIGGCIKFFEMHYVGLVALPGCVDTFHLKGWEAVTKMMKISSMGLAANNWQDDCAIQFSEVPVDSPVYAQMLSNLKPGDDGELTLKKLRGGYPALCLHDQDVVYIVNMPLSGEMQLPSVIALNMRNKAIKSAAYFGGTGRPIGYGFSYLQSGISKHLAIASTTM